MMVVALVIEKLVEAVVPNSTDEVADRLVPWISTVGPPMPLANVTEEMVGAFTKVKAVGFVVIPLVVVTETSTAPTWCAGVLTLMVVGPVAWKLAAAVVPN